MNDRSELFRALGALAERPDAGHGFPARSMGLAEPTREEHTRVFGLTLYPYGSVYLGPEGMIGGEARDRIAGYWRAVGLTPPVEPDHVAALLGLYAGLLDAANEEDDPARRVLRVQAREALLWEHLLPWLPVYLTKMIDLGGAYASWAELLLAALLQEAARGSIPAAPAVHLRSAPPMGWIEDDDAGEFLAAVLAPVRSGFILTRHDLFRCALELGFGVRAGERLFMLRSLLEQDAPNVADWLSEHAAAWIPRYAELRPGLGVVMDHWMERADAAEALLLGLQRAAKEVVGSGSGG